MNIKKNLIVAKKGHRPFLLDYYYQSSKKSKPVVLFVHGFKGFKDWGTWDLIAQEFAKAGFVFIKFNFSHNGTTVEDPLNFADLEAFGHNNYSKELADLDLVLDWLESQQEISREELNSKAIHLIGHSRGGGISVIKAVTDQRISALITWAAVSRLDYSWRHQPMIINEWKDSGVRYIKNGRTKQNMPLYFQLYEDFINNELTLDIEQQITHLQKPFLIIHGGADPAVPLSAAEDLKKWAPHAQLILIPEADHVFDGRHPYEEKRLPSNTQLLVKNSIEFLNKKKTPI